MRLGSLLVEALVGQHRGVAELRRQLVVLLLDFFQFLQKMHGSVFSTRESGSGVQSSSLRYGSACRLQATTNSPPRAFSSSMAVSSALTAVSSWLSSGSQGGDALQPQPGLRRPAPEHSLRLRREADEFIGDARDHRQQREAAHKPHGERAERQKHVDHHGDGHHHQEEARPATRMKARAGARRGHVNGASLLKRPDHFVLGAVVFKDPPDVLPLRDEDQEPKKQGDANHAVQQIEDQEVARRRSNAG